MEDLTDIISDLDDYWNDLEADYWNSLEKEGL
ncbi:MAG: hypothetical protein [Bacteriophage sp.]|jgi:hypothetical protein|nr:MAG: hypothetical protein [Bacteriophage sp.]UVN05206.1 MAG: hypothetical protein [Bacteriophage sp.]